jgi:hypothetical protein
MHKLCATNSHAQSAEILFSNYCLERKCKAWQDPTGPCTATHSHLQYTIECPHSPAWAHVRDTTRSPQHLAPACIHMREVSAARADGEGVSTRVGHILCRPGRPPCVPRSNMASRGAAMGMGPTSYHRRWRAHAVSCR